MISDRITKESVIADILETLPKHLKDESTGNQLYRGCSLNRFCDIKVTSHASQIKVKLILGGSTNGNARTNYKVNDKGDISPNFLKRVTEHTLRHQTVAKNRETRAMQIAEDAKKLSAFIDTVSAIDGITADSYALRNLKNGYRSTVGFDSKDHSFNITLGTDCNGEPILDSMTIGTRSIDLATIKKVIAIFGLEEYNPAQIQRSFKRPDELFDTSLFS
jgi:hypothetical protein